MERRILMRMLTLIAILGAASTGCLRKTEYHCAEDTSCGVSGVCEASGFCSFPDGDCASGRSYTTSAGSLAGTCTDGMQVTIDADLSMPDSAIVDGPMSDTPAAACPAGYVTLTGGQSGHLYKVISTAQDWSVQQAGCVATTTKAYLAVPDDLTELQAMDTAIGAGAVYWVGISDSQTEDTWRTVLGTIQTFLPWLAPAPDDQNPGEDCVAAIATSHQFNDDRCNTNRPAICECGP
jgi:hypothetical protein